MSGKHSQTCIDTAKGCPCNRCAKDNAGEGIPCCVIHRLDCERTECEDFEAEAEE